MRGQRVHVDAPRARHRGRDHLPARDRRGRRAPADPPRRRAAVMDVTRATQLGTWSGRHSSVDGRARRPRARPPTARRTARGGSGPIGDPVAAAPSRGRDPALLPVGADQLRGRRVPAVASRTPTASRGPRPAATLDLPRRRRAPSTRRAVHLCRERHTHSVIAAGHGARARDRVAHLAGAASSDRVSSRCSPSACAARATSTRPTRTGATTGALVVDGKVHDVGDLDTTSLHDVHVQQVVRATWGDRVGLGVLEQLSLGPHAPSGFTESLDGAP